jgi:hypothetical protein
MSSEDMKVSRSSSSDKEELKVSEKESGEKKTVGKKVLATVDDKRIWTYMNNPVNRKFFLDHLARYKGSDVKLSEIKL